MQRIQHNATGQEFIKVYDMAAAEGAPKAPSGSSTFSQDLEQFEDTPLGISEFNAKLLPSLLANHMYSLYEQEQKNSFEPIPQPIHNNGEPDTYIYIGGPAAATNRNSRFDVILKEIDGSLVTYQVAFISNKAEGFTAALLLSTDPTNPQIKALFDGTDPSNLQSIMNNLDGESSAIEIFNKYKECFTPLIEQYLESIPPHLQCQVDINGYSQGGALSQYFAFMLGEKIKEEASVLSKISSLPTPFSPSVSAPEEFSSQSSGMAEDPTAKMFASYQVVPNNQTPLYSKIKICTVDVWNSPAISKNMAKNFTWTLQDIQKINHTQSNPPVEWNIRYHKIAGDVVQQCGELFLGRGLETNPHVSIVVNQQELASRWYNNPLRRHIFRFFKKENRSERSFVKRIFSSEKAKENFEKDFSLIPDEVFSERVETVTSKEIINQKMERTAWKSYTKTVNYFFGGNKIEEIVVEPALESYIEVLTPASASDGPQTQETPAIPAKTVLVINSKGTVENVLKSTAKKIVSVFKATTKKIGSFISSFFYTPKIYMNNRPSQEFLEENFEETEVN